MKVDHGTRNALGETARAGSGEKSPETNVAAEAIKAGIRRWTRGLYVDGPQLPIVRHDSVWAHFGSTWDDPITQVLHGCRSLNYKEKVSSREHLADLASCLRGCSIALSNFGKSDTLGLQRYTKPGRSTERRVIFALGLEKALADCVSMALEGAERRLELLETASEITPRKRGRVKNLAAYSVAAELAKLYSKVTGKRPTYSEDKNGQSGEYTPVLRDVFDALGWNKVALRGPATEAIANITKADLHPKELARPRSLPQCL